MNYLLIGRREFFLICFLLSLLVAVAAISSQSLWIDEANSAMKAVAPTWGEFVARMSVERGSDLQMPLYMIVLWAWEKVVGSSEFALRALNIPFFVWALIIIGCFLKVQKRTALLFALLACTSPFLWSYLNEARPYILEFFAATLVAVGLFNLVLEEKKPQFGGAWIILCGLVLLFATSLSSIPFVFVYGVLFLVLWLKKESLGSALNNRPLTSALLLSGCVVGVFLMYYLWTLKVGARASSVGKTNLMSVVFCFYELSGFLGLGPSRSALRETPLLALKSYALPLLIYGGVLVGFLLLLLRSLTPFDHREKRVFAILGGATLSAICLLFLIGILKDFRVLGRHLMPAYPMILIGLALGSERALKRYGSNGTLLLSLFVVISFISCWELRFFSRHGKDDYRSASATALAALSQGKSIWWAADPTTAAYYHLFPMELHPRTARLWKNTQSNPTWPTPLGGGNADSRVILIISESADTLAAVQPPDVIILSKPDIFDASGSLQHWITANHFKLREKFPAFTIWEKPNSLKYGAADQTR